MSGRMGWGGIMVVMAGIGLAAFGIVERKAQYKALAKDSVAEARWQVEVTHGKPTTHVPDLVVPGQLQAWVDTPLYAHASGYLKQWNVDIGERVKAGQVIAVLSTPDLDAEEAQAAAQVKSAQANAELARLTASRYAVLLPTHTVSPQDADSKRLDAEAQQTLWEAARANLQRLQALDQYRYITAPVAGIVTTRNIDVGGLVDSGSANGRATELFHLADIHRLRAYVPVPESEVMALPAGGTVTLSLREFPGKMWQANLIRHAHAVDPLKHTELVELTLDNPGDKLLPGSYLEAHFPRQGAAQTLTLPANTLIFRASGTSVAVLKGNEVHLKAVIVGRDFGDRLEILSGLSPADSVVVSPPDSLAEGDQVIAHEAKGAP